MSRTPFKNPPPRTSNPELFKLLDGTQSLNQWAPRGGVLRCTIDDGGGVDGSLPIISIDDQEFSWDEFGRMLCTHAGWGMRVIFVPDDELEQVSKIAVREPNE